MQKQNNILNFEGQNIYVGFDAHLKSWQVTILTENMFHKTFVMLPKPEVLSNYLKDNFPKGQYFSAYEAGFSGLWAHYQLKALGLTISWLIQPTYPLHKKKKCRKRTKGTAEK
jgi:transposase